MTNIIRHIKSSINDIKRRVFQSERYGKDDIVEIEQGSEFGIDSNPPKGTPLLMIKTDRASYVIGSISGFKESDYGEFRAFSTDSEGKEIKTYVHLLNNGEIHLGGDEYSAVRYEELKSQFDKLRDDFNDLVSKYNSHVHTTTATVGTGSVGVISPTTSTGTPSTVDLTNAESKDIKLK